MLLKLAYSGMKGRKKESLLLGFVILLSVIFIVTTSVLHTSNQAAKAEERIASFGPWQNGYFRVLDEELNTILETDEGSHIGQSQLLGYAPSIGLIGSYNASYESLTNLQMVEGKMPSDHFEIAIEHNKLATYPYAISIGDEIDVPITLTLQDSSEDDIMIHQLKRIRQEYRAAASAVIHSDVIDQDPLYTDAEELIMTYGHYLAKYKESPESLEQDLEVIDYYIYTLENEITDQTAVDNYALLLYDGYDSKQFSYNDRAQYRRKILDTAYYDDFTLNLKTVYQYHYIRRIIAAIELASGERPASQDEVFLRDGIMTNLDMVFTVKMKVTGFYENHNAYWDLGDAELPNAYINQTLYNSIHKVAQDNSLLDLKAHAPYTFSSYGKSNLLLDSAMDPWLYYEKHHDNHQSLRVNSYTYPEEKFEADNTLTYAILVMIFIATIIAVLQINLSQIKRRSKKLTLLKSIGMVKTQMLGLLAFEMVILIAIAFPLGLSIGLGLVYGLVEAINAHTNIALIFTLDMGLILLGLSVTFISVVIGMSFPLYLALKTPLTGAMNLAPPRQKKAKVQKHKNYKTKKQNFSRISWSYLMYEKKSNLISLMLYSIAITVLLTTLFLAFFSFDRYKDQVTAVDRPDYALEMIRGAGFKEIEEISQALDAIPEVRDYQFMKYGVDAYLYNDNFTHHDVYKAHYENRDFVNLKIHSEQAADFMNKSLKTKIYGIDKDSYVWQTMTQNMKAVDIDAFENENSALLLMPQYKPEDATSLSYSVFDRNHYSKAYGIGLGDKLQIGIRDESEGIPLVQLSTQKGAIDLLYTDFEIIGISHHFDAKGLWPFSYTLESPVVVVSMDTFNSLYPRSKYRSRMPLHQFKTLIETQFPTAYANTSIYIYIHKGQVTPALNIALQRLGLVYQTPLTSLIEEKESIFQECFKLAAIIITLGLSIALIILMILFNTSQSKVENERCRIGTLQALGVTKKQFIRLYILTGLAYGLLALAFAHMSLGLVVTTMAIFTGAPLKTGLQEILWLYPYKVHLAIGCGFLGLTLITYALPLLKVLKHQPIYNINNNQR